MVAFFSLYKYLLNASYVFSLCIAVISGITLSAGKELLDKYVTRDDVITSISGIILGFIVISLFF